MSNYTVTFDGAAKDALSTGDPGKVIKGADMDTEFDNIATAVATKANKKVPATTSNLAILDASGDLGDSTFETNGTAITANLTGTADLATLATAAYKLVDSNGVDAVLVGTAASAVNEVTITNAADGSDLSIAATGDATNIGINLVPKGTGELQNAGVAVPKMTLSATTATTSGTSVTISGVPSWAKKITFMLNGVSLDSASTLTLQLGYSGGIETTGYITGVAETGATGAVASTEVWYLAGGGAAASSFHGTMTLTLQDSATNTWTGVAMTYEAVGLELSWSVGTKSLSGVLTQLKLGTNLGGNFDAGSVSVLYEG